MKDASSLCSPAYDAVIIVSFGGPEGPDEVMPFLEHVVTGRRVPRERLTEVAKQYDLFGGVSPINSQNRALVSALGTQLAEASIPLRVYWGNRHSAPWLSETVAQMAADGVRRALAFVTSPYPSQSGCRQYLDDIAAARLHVGPGAPEIDKLRLFFDHPGWIEPWVGALTEARTKAGDDAPVLFSAHSIPEALASTCGYQAALLQTADLVAGRAGCHRWELVFQSRSGPPTEPWLGPDVSARITALAAEIDGLRTVVIAPIGFVSDHMEVLFDLDVRAASAAAEAGVRLVRAPTPGTHPRFVRMIRELIQERLEPETPRLSLGRLEPTPGCGTEGCCSAVR
ncbi:MAG: ferrochelatase [Actinomycetota bacterium]|nr:ferrochelatase [Actinomycetota bacterium]